MTPAPSQIQSAFDFSLLLEWGVVIGVLAFLFYAARKISLEKTEYEEDAETYHFFGLDLLIPKWWTLIPRPDIDSMSVLYFKRTDTHYDWYARIENRQAPTTQVHSESLALSTIEKFLEENEIILDEHEKLTTLQKEHLIKSEDLCDRIESFARVEGTGTEKQTERLYIDLCCFSVSGDQALYFFESKSSVLNGCLEGPYFEEVLKKLVISPQD